MYQKLCVTGRGGKQNVAQGGSYVSASNFRNYLDFKEQLLHCYNFFAYDLHIAKQKKTTTKQQQQGIETEEGITISYLSDIINCASILGMTLFGKTNLCRWQRQNTCCPMG